MDFKDTFFEFYEEVKKSINIGTFAKLTLAKTIGNTDLMNIYVRPIVDEKVLKFELKFKFQREEILEIKTIEDTFYRLLEFINNPFLSAILFTKEFDLVYKLNKKRSVSVQQQLPSFGNANEVLIEYLTSKN